MRIKYNGHVGIGTTDPRGKLHVQDVSANSGNQLGLVISDNQGGSSGTTLPAIGFAHNSGTIFRGGIQMVSESSNLEKGMIFRVGRSGSIGGFDAHPLANVPERMRINRNGNVGIGTANPTNTLHVNGGITTGGISSTGGFVTTTGIQISMASGAWYNIVDYRSYRYAWKRMFIAGYRTGYNLTGNATFYVTTDTGNWFATLTQEYNYGGVEFRVSNNHIQGRQVWYLGNTESMIFRIVSLT
jgi:hypothetical protein